MADEKNSHEELHEHVNPHLEVHQVPKDAYKTNVLHSLDEPLKSRFRLDWIYTKIKIGKLHPFPIVTILLLGLGLIPIILATLNIPLPMTIAKLPFLKSLLEFLGIYNDKDLFVISTWVYWWPIFIIAIFVFKRIWCGGFCPFGLMTDIGNFFGKKLRKGEQPKPINITKYIFIGFLVFKALGYLHDAIGITNSAVLTLEFVVFFIVYSFIIGMIAPRRTFCRVFCFLGSLPHLFGRLSIYTLETDRSKCAKCEGQWCLRGHKAAPAGIATNRGPLINLDGCPMFINIPQLSHTESNRNCILCGNCIKNCPYDAIHYKPKVPGYELYKGIDLNFHETIFVLGLVPLLAMFLAMESGLLASFAIYFNFPANSHWLITLSFYLIMIAIMTFIYYLVTGIGSIILNVNYKLALRNFGYIFLPFAYMAMIKDILLTYFLKGSFIPVKFPAIVAAYPFIDTTLILIGAAWSVYMAKKISEATLRHASAEANDDKATINTLLHAVPITGLAYFWISQMMPEYNETLSYFGIHFMAPFALSFALIGGFAMIVVHLDRIKKLFNREIEAADE